MLKRCILGRFMFTKTIYSASRAPRRLARCGRRRGAALIEFAMIAVLFFTMLLGMIQFGIYQSSASTLWAMSREGARMAAVQNSSSATANQNIYNRVLAAAPGNIDKTNYSTSDTPSTGKLSIGIFPQAPSQRPSGSTARVEVAYDMTDKMIVPMASLFFPADFRRNGKVIYKTVTTMRVE